METGKTVPIWQRALAALASLVLVAAWSGVLGWYEALRWWDVGVYFLTTGAIGAMAYFVCSRFGHNFLSEDIFVGYDDTILDLAAGTRGSLLAGAVMAWWSSRRSGIAGQESSTRIG